MIKVFRNIRRLLIDQNNMGKYLKYAIGEILLVVIGILIALQINNWNEQRKLDKKEQAFLNEINLDFKSNKSQLDSIIANNSVSYHAAQQLIVIMATFNHNDPQRTQENEHFADSVVYYNNLMWKNKSFNPKNGTVEALLNSSSFDLIRNDTLRRLLISWKDVLGDYLEEEKFAENFLYNEYGPWARTSFDPDATDDPENSKAFFSKTHRNYIYQLKGDLYNSLKTVRDEGVVKMIDDIIRLTEPDNR